jgi:hypothetical protein
MAPVLPAASLSFITPDQRRLMQLANKHRGDAPLDPNTIDTLRPKLSPAELQAQREVAAAAAAAVSAAATMSAAGADATPAANRPRLAEALGFRADEMDKLDAEFQSYASAIDFVRNVATRVYCTVRTHLCVCVCVCIAGRGPAHL